MIPAFPSDWYEVMKVDPSDIEPCFKLVDHDIGFYPSATPQMHPQQNAESVCHLACRRVGRLQAGQYFGEVACWTGERRTASVVTITSCELYCLRRDTLLSLVKEWPEISKELRFHSVHPSRIM
jgi:hypothetical protein